MLLALLLLAAPACREIHDAQPRVGTTDDKSKIAIIECAGERALTYSKRTNASADWTLVHRVKIAGPQPNQAWFFDGALCNSKVAKADDPGLNHAVLAHARAATGEFPEWTPVQSYHVNMKKGVWVKDDAKKMVCHPEPI